MENIRNWFNSDRNWFQRDDSAGVFWMVSATVWLVLGVTMGFILAIEFVFPDFAAGIPYLVFGRLRQAHTNTVMFAWLSPGMIGMWFYMVPRLAGRKLWSELLGNIAALLWNIALAIGVVAILLGVTQSREYAEMIWAVDVMVIVVLLMNLVNFYVTISKRVDRSMYVSMWYITGTLIWMPMLYFIGNVMWNPSTGALIGINDSIFNWFYGHNVLGLWFTTGLLAAIYFIIPRETHTPIYSHVLSLIGFLGNALFYTGVGGHHLEWAPIPYWLQTIAVAESIGMILVVVAFMMNILLTMRGNWNRIATSLPLRFAITGFIAYVLVSYQGTHQAIRNINLLTHFTQYVPGHAHLSLLFFSASVIMGGMYYMIPRIYHVRLYSRSLANVQYPVYVIGFLLFFGGFLGVGFIQGSAWLHSGLPVFPVLSALRPFFALRIVGGVLLWIGFILFAVNIWATIAVRKPAIEPVIPVQDQPQTVRGNTLNPAGGGYEGGVP